MNAPAASGAPAAPGPDIFRFRRNLVLAASAGTGKTHALVGVLLHVLLGASELGGAGARGAVDPARVVATTFSRKAAAEIRERVVRELGRLAGGEDSAYAAALGEALVRGGTAEAARPLREAARRALAGVGRAQIGTLHGFAHAIARAHALELGLPPGFGLAGEEDGERMIEQAAEDALGAVARERPEDVRDFLRLVRGSERAIELVGRLLTRLEEDGRGASSVRVAEDDAARIDAHVADVVDAARAVADHPRFGEAAKAVVRAYAAGDAPGLAGALAALFGARRPAGELDTDLARLFRLRDASGSGAHGARGEALGRAWASRDRAGAMPRVLCDVLGHGERALHQAYARAGVLGFGAVLRAARDALLHHPRRAAEVAARYDVLLVDEFQDTSRVQCDVVRMLWEQEPASREPGRPPAWGAFRPSGLLVVGDRKQSIYAFRGADVGVFSAMCVELAGEAAREGLGIPAGLVPASPRPTADFVALKHSHRSEAALLRFINAASAACLQPESGELDEVRYVPETEELSVPPGHVPRADDARPRTVWMRPPGAGEGDVTDTGRIDDARLAVQAVRSMMASGERRRDGAPLAFRDFAVLAQSNAMLDATAWALSQAAIPHVVAGRGFYAAREVQDLLLLLRAVVRADDRVALAGALRGPFAALHDDSLVGLTEPHRGITPDLDAWGRGARAALLRPSDRAAVERLRATLVMLRRNVHRLGPGGVLRAAVEELGLERTLVLMPRGAQRIANVHKLLLLADGEPDAEAFLERARRAEQRDRETEAATFSEDDDAVRLLTVHASKGLAFPVVILPELGRSGGRPTMTTVAIDLACDPPLLATKFLDAQGDPQESPSYRDLLQSDRRRGRAERRRLFYVALTRAESWLLLVGDAKPTPARADGRSLGSVARAVLGGPAGDALETRAVAPGDPEVAAHHAAAVIALGEDLGTLREAAVAVATTTLQDFSLCARRFYLAHLLDLPEGAARTTATARAGTGTGGLDPRDEGVLTHRVLERVDAAAFGAADVEEAVGEVLERDGLLATDPALAPVRDRAGRFLRGAYARRVREAGAVLQREEPFALDVGAGDPRITLRGVMDLVVRWPDGRVDVVDYKRSRGPSVAAHALQLDVYALAARALYGARKVRAGVLFLGGDAEEPRFVPAPDEAHARAAIEADVRALLAARQSERYPRVEEARCRAIHCGYVGLCHPPAARRQLTLFG